MVWCWVGDCVCVTACLCVCLCEINTLPFHVCRTNQQTIPSFSYFQKPSDFFLQIFFLSKISTEKLQAVHKTGFILYYEQTKKKNAYDRKKVAISKNKKSKQNTEN